MSLFLCDICSPNTNNLDVHSRFEGQEEYIIVFLLVQGGQIKNAWDPYFFDLYSFDSQNQQNIYEQQCEQFCQFQVQMGSPQFKFSLFREYFRIQISFTMKLFIPLLLFIINVQFVHSALHLLGSRYKLNLQANRTQMLNLINEVRQSLNKNLSMLYLDPTLNRLSDIMTSDMIKRDFFDHVNPDNKNPSDRAKSIGFNYPVGENIAIGINVTNIHNNLMKSPGHYAVTINPQWRRCGVGLQYNSKGHLYCTITFSSRDINKSPIKESQEKDIKSSISAYILEKNKQLKQQDAVLSEHLRKFYNQIQPAGSSSVWEYLKQVKYSKPDVNYASSSAKLQWSSNYIQKLKDMSLFTISSPKLTKFGVGLRIKGQNIQVFVVFATK